MQIRTRLTLQFLLLGGIIMMIASMAIYYASANFRRQDFHNRLINNSLIAAKLLLEADDIDAGRVQKLERDNPVKLYNEKIIILNFKDDTLYSSDKNDIIRMSYENVERIRKFENIGYLQGEYTISGTLYTSRFDRFVVLAAATDTDGQIFLKKLQFILLFVTIISLLLFSVAGWIYSGRALKPISDVVGKVEEISVSSLNLRLNEGNGKDELSRLAKTFNKMLARLETAFAMQKDFISNASHELRTPLTSINGQLEVLMLKDRSTGEYKTATTSVLDDIKSLIILLNRLLLMARTSSESETNSDKKTRIDELLWQIQEELKKTKTGTHIDISLDESLSDSEQMVVAGDEYLLKTALSNLIENACKYSEDKSAYVTLRQHEKWIEIVIKDQGIGIPEGELEKVFEPFFRGSNAKSIQGTGIGLPLVNQIIKKHHGTLDITSVLNKGTTVLVRLPLIV